MNNASDNFDNHVVFDESINQLNNIKLLFFLCIFCCIYTIIKMSHGVVTSEAVTVVMANNDDEEEILSDDEIPFDISICNIPPTSFDDMDVCVPNNSALQPPDYDSTFKEHPVVNKYFSLK